VTRIAERQYGSFFLILELIFLIFVREISWAFFVCTLI
jgi:hypothetical protein